MYSRLYLILTMVFLVGFSVNSLPFPSGKAEWPLECEGKSYCHIKPTNYPTEQFTILLQVNNNTTLHVNSDLTNRSHDGTVYRESTDVAGCISREMFQRIYLIKDENDHVRFVPQHPNFALIVRVAECSNPGRIHIAPHLQQNLLKDLRVHCMETRVAMKFPVLSLDGSKLETTVAKNGIPLSCSAKVILD